MKKICFVTGTRADYGIMAPLMKTLNADPDIELQIIATNMHLSSTHGMTVREIEADGLPVTRRIESLLSSDTPSATVKSLAMTEMGMADVLPELQPDLIVILGDRYEMLAAASAALIFRIPIAHLYGGETTEGAYDDCIRHAITQLSTYHFTSTQEYADRVIRMGAKPENVHWVGSLGVDNIRNEKMMSREELAESLGWNPGERYMVATFHPATAQPGEEERQTKALLTALDEAISDGWKVLFTMPNSDTGGNRVAAVIREWGDAKGDKVKCVASLGRKRFYSALRHAAAMVGNSSSGLIEAPAFGIPTLNVGDRQKGRARGESVVDVAAETNAIKAGLRTVLDPEFRKKAVKASNPYEKPDTLLEILQHLKDIEM